MGAAFGTASNRHGLAAPSATPAAADHGERAPASADGTLAGDVADGRERTAELPVLEDAAISVATPGGKAISPADVTAEAPNACEALLPPEREAILEVQCFAGPRVLHNGEELWPSAAAGREQKAFQLLLFLAAHSTDGVDRDKAAEALLADDESVDPVATLRQWRKRVRALLGRLLPDLPEDLFEDSGRSYRLNPRMVRSDVQRFLELERFAKSKARRNPEPAYEAMRALYVGDLFDRAAAQPYAWAVAPGPGGESLVQEYHQR